MKRYIASAYRYPSGTSRNRVQYTSIDDLHKLLADYGITRANAWRLSDQGMLEIPLQFVAGPATLNINGYNYKILFDGKVMLEGALINLFRDYAQDYVIYKKMSAASPSRIMKANDPEAAQKKLRADRLKEIKNMSISEMLEYINGIRNIDDDIAQDAMRQFLYKIPDDDLVTLTNGHWRMEVVDSKAENWASLSMQAYGYHYTTTVELETSKDTYTVDVRRTEGWHTE